MAATETIDRRVLGPYEGQRISGTSGNVIEVVLTVEYRFPKCIVRVNGVPARYDQQTGREYVAARDGAAIMRAVRERAEAAKDAGAPSHVELDAATILPAA